MDAYCKKIGLPECCVLIQNFLRIYGFKKSALVFDSESSSLQKKVDLKKNKKKVRNLLEILNHYLCLVVQKNIVSESKLLSKKLEFLCSNYSRFSYDGASSVPVFNHSFFSGDKDRTEIESESKTKIDKPTLINFPASFPAQNPKKDLANKNPSDFDKNLRKETSSEKRRGNRRKSNIRKITSPKRKIPRKLIFRKAKRDKVAIAEKLVNDGAFAEGLANAINKNAEDTEKIDFDNLTFSQNFFDKIFDTMTNDTKINEKLESVSELNLKNEGDFENVFLENRQGKLSSNSKERNISDQKKDDSKKEVEKSKNK